MSLMLLDGVIGCCRSTRAFAAGLWRISSSAVAMLLWSSTRCRRCSLELWRYYTALYCSFITILYCVTTDTITCTHSYFFLYTSIYYCILLSLLNRC